MKVGIALIESYAFSREPATLENRWQDMVRRIPDAMAEEFATIGPADEIGARLWERSGGLLTTLNLPTDFPLHSAADQRRAGELIDLLHAAPGRS